MLKASFWTNAVTHHPMHCIQVGGRWPQIDFSLKFFDLHWQHNHGPSEESTRNVVSSLWLVKVDFPIDHEDTGPCTTQKIRVELGACSDSQSHSRCRYTIGHEASWSPCPPSFFWQSFLWKKFSCSSHTSEVGEVPRFLTALTSLCGLRKLGLLQL